jgi:hypothetical protein
MGVLHMPTAAGHHPLKSCPRHEAPPQIILKSVTFTMTTESPSRAPPRGASKAVRIKCKFRTTLHLKDGTCVSEQKTSVAVFE